jgi:hypothetical protein
MFTPSFLSSAISGIIIFTVFIYFIFTFKNFSSDPYKLMVILLLIGIGFGIHSISHNYLEIYYDFNPFKGKWSVKDPELKTSITNSKLDINVKSVEVPNLFSQ